MPFICKRNNTNIFYGCKDITEYVFDKFGPEDQLPVDITEYVLDFLA